jgi:hypothetical protein
VNATLPVPRSWVTVLVQTGSMTRSRSHATFLRRARPWLIGIGVAQLVIRIGGRVLAKRLNTGDESSSILRRVQTMGQVSLRPTSHELSSIQFDLAFAGLNLDLTRARPAPGGIDVGLTCVLAGGNIRVPSEWRIASETRGLGGVTMKGTGQANEPQDSAGAALRIHLRAFLGGVTVKT